MNEPPVVEQSESARLVAAARGGDRAAFGRLYGLYSRMVHGILLARVPPAEVADLVQDVSYWLSAGSTPCAATPPSAAGWR